MAARERETATGTHDVTRHRGPVTGWWRSNLFRLWVVATGLMLGGGWALGRLLEPDRIGLVTTAVVFPVLTATLVFASLAWLAWIVFGPARRNPPKRDL